MTNKLETKPRLPTLPVHTPNSRYPKKTTKPPPHPVCDDGPASSPRAHPSQVRNDCTRPILTISLPLRHCRLGTRRDRVATRGLGAPDLAPVDKVALRLRPPASEDRPHFAVQHVVRQQPVRARPRAASQAWCARPAPSRRPPAPGTCGHAGLERFDVGVQRAGAIQRQDVIHHNRQRLAQRCPAALLDGLDAVGKEPHVLEGMYSPSRSGAPGTLQWREHSLCTTATYDGLEATAHCRGLVADPGATTGRRPFDRRRAGIRLGSRCE